MKYTRPLLEVMWLDAETTHGWEVHEEVDAEQVPIVTVGFFIKQSPHMLVVASTIDNVEGTQSNSRIKIPIGMIVSVKELNTTVKKTRGSPLLNPLCEEIPDPRPEGLIAALQRKEQS
jgi:hypothetical protein